MAFSYPCRFFTTKKRTAFSLTFLLTFMLRTGMMHPALAGPAI